MKYISRNVLIFLLKLVFVFAIFSTWSCKKNEEKDYRDYYTGNYSFLVRAYKTTETDSTYLDTTWNYNGKIYNSDYSDAIYIRYFSSFDMIAVLSDNGHVSNVGVLDGSFEGLNKIKFVVRLRGFNFMSTDSVTGTR